MSVEADFSTECCSTLRVRLGLNSHEFPFHVLRSLRRKGGSSASGHIEMPFRVCFQKRNNFPLCFQINHEFLLVPSQVLVPG